MLSTKRGGKSYAKVTRFYFRACSPLSIRVCKSAMRTNTYRLLRKAEANVTAVLEGTFGRAK